MRELTSHKVNGCNDQITVSVLDDPGHGGASHQYAVVWRFKQSAEDPGGGVLIGFQNGPIKEVGTNGITHEALLAILEDRLTSFQNGPYACEENGAALYHVQEAQRILKARTLARLARGVEGTHKP